MSAKATWRSFSSIISGAAKICSASTTHMMLSSLMRSRMDVVHERQRNAGGVGDSAGLEQDVFGLLGTSHEFGHCSGQIVADVAADAAVGEIDDVAIVFNSDDELGIDVDGTEVVHQHRDAQAVIAGQDAVQQRRLASAKKAGQNGQRHRGRN